MYKIADSLGCMSQGNIDYVLDHNPEVPKSKAAFIAQLENPNAQSGGKGN